MPELEAPVSWEAILMAMAHTIAMRSRDPSTKVGAVLVSPDRKHISIGYNGFPSGMVNYSEWWNARGEGMTKDTLVRHAEENCLANCTADVTGWDLYVTHHPCIRCAGLCVHKKLRTVFYHNDIRSKYQPETARAIFQAGNVQLVRF